jgi:hypothetical protein
MFVSVTGGISFADGVLGIVGVPGGGNRPLRTIGGWSRVEMAVSWNEFKLP